MTTDTTPKLVGYRCTECDTVHKTFKSLTKCHWGIGGFEEVYDTPEETRYVYTPGIKV